MPERPGRDREALLGTLAAPGEFPGVDAASPALATAEAVGIDTGATLVKICAESGGARHFATWPSPSTERLVEWLERVGPTHIGVSGCGAAALLSRLDGRTKAEPRTAIEFETWTLGANEALARLGEPPTAPYLLVPIGTGTSALRVDGDAFERVGGTALGGGAALGLGHALLGVTSAEALNALALGGRREAVDLLVSDLFDDTDGVGAMIASSFGKVARNAGAAGDGADDAARPGAAGDGADDAARPAAAETPTREDLAAATLGIVADNIALLTVAHARACGVERIVFGGSTFYTHPQIALTVQGYAAISGFEASVLPLAGHVGALGAMLLGKRD